MRKALLASVSVAVLLGCATTSSQAASVAFYRWAPTVEWLTARDRVVGTCRLIQMEDFGDNGGPITRSHVREYAAQIHADTVLWWEYSEDPARVEGDLAILLAAGVRGIAVTAARGGVSHVAFFACREKRP